MDGQATHALRQTTDNSRMVLPLRYPGGKRRMLSFLRPHIEPYIGSASRYFEPFLGSGAVFFYFRPKNAVLSDINRELIDVYRAIRYAPRKVWRVFSSFGNDKSDYFYVRDCFRPTTIAERAARTLYLNRTCFKGMWRHNRFGDFNVGYGGQDRRWTVSEELLRECSKVLKNVRLRCADFEKVVAEASQNDFIFADPPYRPGEKEVTNEHYTYQQFSYQDYERLARCLSEAYRRGVGWALTISSHKEILLLFKGFFRIDLPFGTGRMPGILSNTPGEVLITSYESVGGRRI